MEKFVIEGGVPLTGTVVPAGNKNAALPLLACALLTDEDVVLHNVPRIRDTEALLDLLADLGTTVERPDTNTVKLNAANVHKTDVDANFAERIGSNVMQVPGVAKLGGCEYTVSPDHIEIASFMALAGVTGGELRIQGCIGEDLRMIRMVFRRLGLDSWMEEDGTCFVPGDQ